jgi:hypothetical protein
MTQTVHGASVGVLLDVGGPSFILGRDTLAPASPVTPVRTYLGSTVAANGTALLNAAADITVGTLVVVAVTFDTGTIVHATGGSGSPVNDFDFIQTGVLANGTQVGVLWCVLGSQIDAGDDITVEWDTPAGDLNTIGILGASFTGMGGSVVDGSGHAIGDSTSPAASLTTTGPADVIVEVFVNIDTVAAHTLTMTDGATVAGSQNAGGVGSIRLASRIVGAAGSYTVSGTWGSGSTAWSVLAVAFQPSAGSILHGGGSEMSDITNPVLSMDVTWGSRSPAGLLTEVEAGQATISILDPLRDFDPANLGATAALNAGVLGQITVDGNPAFTGYLDSAEHTLAGMVSTIVLKDALPKLSNMAVVTQLPIGATDLQFVNVMDALGITDYTILGGTGIDRDTEPIVMNAWAALQRIRDAEAGALYIDRAGEIVFLTRGYSSSPGSRGDIGDGGIPLMDIITMLDRNSIVNYVAVDMTDPTPDLFYRDDSSIAHNGQLGYSRSQEELLILHGTTAYDAWGNTILSKMANGVQATRLGQLIPNGAQVALLVCAEFGSLFHVIDSGHGEPIDRNVLVRGMSWAVSPDGWTVDLITEDVP